MNESILNEEKFRFELENATVELPLEDYDSIVTQNEKLRKLMTNIATLYADPYQEIDNLNSAIDILLSNASTQEIIGKIGERIYSIHKSDLEKKHWGKFVVIDINNENIVAIGSTPVIAMVEARRIKNKNYFLRQVGINTTIN